MSFQHKYTDAIKNKLKLYNGSTIEKERRHHVVSKIRGRADGDTNGPSAGPVTHNSAQPEH